MYFCEEMSALKRQEQRCMRNLEHIRSQIELLKSSRKYKDYLMKKEQKVLI